MTVAPIDRSLSGKLPPALTKNISPLIGGALYPGNPYGQETTYYPRTDPVLTVLTGSDERAFKQMIRTSSAISGAIRQRKRGLMAQGWRVVEGPSRSPAAALLRDWTESFVKAIPNFNVLRAEVLDAIYYGWRPVELQWSSDDFRFKGRPYVGIASAVAHDPWFFQFTMDRVLMLASTWEKGQVFDQPDDRLRFMIATAGSTQTPYGQSELSDLWLLYFVSKQFEKLSGIAMQRALGLIRAIRKQAATGSITAPPKESEVGAELAAILAKLNSNNILVESQSYSLDVIEQASAANNIVSLNTYFDDKLRIGIVGQNLSSSVKGGSFAATNAHVDILESYQESDAQEELTWWNDGLIIPAIMENFPQPDDDDIPVWQSRMIDRPSLAATQTLYDMGARIDGRRVAEGFRAPLFIGDEGPDDVVLQKQAAPAIGASGAPGAGGSPAIAISQKQQLAADEGEPDDTTRTRTAVEIAAERAIDRATDSVAGALDPELKAYYAELTRAYLEANPDPKA